MLLRNDRLAGRSWTRRGMSCQAGSGTRPGRAKGPSPVRRIRPGERRRDVLALARVLARNRSAVRERLACQRELGHGSRSTRASCGCNLLPPAFIGRYFRPFSREASRRPVDRGERRAHRCALPHASRQDRRRACAPPHDLLTLEGLRRALLQRPPSLSTTGSIGCGRRPPRARPPSYPLCRSRRPVRLESRSCAVERARAG